MSIPEAEKPRRYDATRRRERAEQERRATRARVIDAATKLFVSRGYTGTTMAAIAAEAGVAMQSVYSAGASKADLLHHAVDLAVAGDDEQMMVHERPMISAVAEESDPVVQVRMIANAIFIIHRRSAPIQRAQIEASAVDSTVRERREALQRGRLATIRYLVAMLPADRLRHSVDECADAVWSFASPEAIDLMIRVRGWDWDQIHEWLERSLMDLLLVDQHRAS